MRQNSGVHYSGEGILGDIRDDTVAGFKDIYGKDPHGLWSAPGVIRLIGDHTEYADGHTLCVAIDSRTVVGLAVRSDRTIRVASTHRDEIAEISLDDLEPKYLEGWPLFPLGVAWMFGQMGVDLDAVPGLDLYVETDVPVGIGLGASAALCTAVAIALNDAWQTHLDTFTLAKVCDRVESMAAGEKVGLGPALASLTAEDGTALLFDARSNDFDQVPLNFEAAEAAFLVIATEGEIVSYPPLSERLTALEDIAEQLGVSSLRDVKAADISGHDGWGEVDPAMVPLATHIVRENQRVLEVVRELRESGPSGMGQLLLDSHASLAETFGKQSAEVSLAIETALDYGAFGAKLIGHRASRSVVAVIPSAVISRVCQALDGAFSEHGFAAPDTYVAFPSAKATRH